MSDLRSVLLLLLQCVPFQESAAYFKSLTEEEMKEEGRTGGRKKGKREEGKCVPQYCYPYNPRRHVTPSTALLVIKKRKVGCLAIWKSKARSALGMLWNPAT